MTDDVFMDQGSALTGDVSYVAAGETRAAWGFCPPTCAAEPDSARCCGETSPQDPSTVEGSAFRFFPVYISTHLWSSARKGPYWHHQ